MTDTTALLPCPFCGDAPHVGPDDPKREGNAFGYVECLNSDCPAKPRVEDGEIISDERGSDEYRRAAILRWNTRHTIAPNGGMLNDGCVDQFAETSEEPKS
jgi:hypothetical protein